MPQTMSALGHKRTFTHLQPMSALPPKADIGTQPRNVRFVPKADIFQAIEFRSMAAGETRSACNPAMNFRKSECSTAVALIWIKTALGRVMICAETGN